VVRYQFAADIAAVGFDEIADEERFAYFFAGEAPPRFFLRISISRRVILYFLVKSSRKWRGMGTGAGYFREAGVPGGYGGNGFFQFYRAAVLDQVGPGAEHGLISFIQLGMSVSWLKTMTLSCGEIFFAASFRNGSASNCSTRRQSRLGKRIDSSASAAGRLVCASTWQYAQH